MHWSLTSSEGRLGARAPGSLAAAATLPSLNPPLEGPQGEAQRSAFHLTPESARVRALACSHPGPKASCRGAQGIPLMVQNPCIHLALTA